MKCGRLHWNVLVPPGGFASLTELGESSADVRKSHEGQAFLLPGWEQLNPTRSHAEGQNRNYVGRGEGFTHHTFVVRMWAVGSRTESILGWQSLCIHSAKFTVPCAISQFFWAQCLGNEEVCFCEPGFVLHRHSGKLNI